jgi:hypothetical protein
MTATDERQDLHQFAEDLGWRYRDSDRTDIYSRGTTRIQVLWRGKSAISGASLYRDDVLMSYTRELATAKEWMAR